MKSRLAALTVVALSALTLTASIAHATTTAEFAPEAEEGTAKVKAEGGPITVVEGEDTVSCEKYTVSGELGETSPSLSLTPSYSGCSITVSGKKEAATVKTNSCTLKISNEEGVETKAEEADFTGTLSVAPSTCGGIVFEDALCKFEIPAQEIAKGVTLKDTEGSGLEISSNVGATVKASCAPCPKMAFKAFDLGAGIGALLGKLIVDEVITTQLTVPTKIKFVKANEELSLTIENNELFAIWLVNYKLEGAGAGSFEEPKGCKRRLFLAFNLNSCTIKVKALAAGKANLVFKAAIKKRVVGKTELEL